MRLDEIEEKSEGPWVLYTYALRVHTHGTKENRGQSLCRGRLVTLKHGVSSDQTGHTCVQHT